MKKIAAVCIAMALMGGSASAAGFVDVDGHWAQNTINALADKGLINGVGSGYFEPNGHVTRAQYLKMMMDTAGIAPAVGLSGVCLDANASDWYAPYLQSALTKGLLPRQMITGYKAELVKDAAGEYAYVSYDGAFSGNVAITREEAAFLSMSTFQYVLNANTMRKLAEPSKVEFTDEAEIEKWAYSAVKMAADNGVITGMDDGSFAPKESTTRAQAAVIMERILNILQK